MPERAVTFACGDETLVGIVQEPEATPRDLGVLIVVGGPQYRVGSHRQFVLMARALCSAGYPVLRFDYRGMGDSDGRPRSFEDVDDDIRAAIDEFFDASPSIQRVALFGLCDAASAALIYCIRRDPRVCSLILANPWVRTEAGAAKAYVHHYYGQRVLQREFWRKLLAGQVDLSASIRGLFGSIRRSRGRAYSASRDVAGHFTSRMLAGLDAFGKPVLLVMSGRDLTAREFDDLSRSDNRWRSALSVPSIARVDLPAADHTFSSGDAIRIASDEVVSWLNAQSPRRA